MARQLSSVHTKFIRLYYQANLPSTHTHRSHCSPSIYCGFLNWRRCVTLALGASCLAWATMIHPVPVLGQNPAPNVQYTNKTVDLGLRGNLTVNPSTLGLEIQIPLGSYPGRAGLDVPIAISYSSKVHNIKYYAYNPGHYTSSGVPIGDGYTMVLDRFAE